MPSCSPSARRSILPTPPRCWHWPPPTGRYVTRASRTADCGHVRRGGRGRRADAATPGRRPQLSLAEAHVQADGGSGPAGAQLDEIAHLVDHPESLAAENVKCRPAAAGQRVGDPALVVDLADEAVRSAPDIQCAAGPCVAEGVGGDLADRQHEVGGAAGGEASLDRVAGDEV